MPWHDLSYALVLQAKIHFARELNRNQNGVAPDSFLGGDMSQIVVGIVSRKLVGGAIRRSILNAMACVCANDGGGIYASIQYIAMMAEVGERCAQEHIRAFEREGLLRQTGERLVYGRYMNEWSINLDLLDQMPELDWKSQRLNGVSPRKKGVGRKLSKATGARGAPQPEVAAGCTGRARGVHGAHPIKGEDKGRNKDSSDLLVDELWGKWPRTGRERTSKPKVRAAIAKLKTTEGVAAAAAAYLRSADAKKDGGAYVPGLHTWLSNKLETWLDLSKAIACAETKIIVSPDWFKKLRVRFVDACAEADWKTMWARMEPIADGNPIQLRATTEALHAAARMPVNLRRFERAVGRPVEVLAPAVKGTLGL